MPISRTFLDWSQPALPAVAQYLIDHYGRGEQLDLGNVLLVLPGRRAGRRLLELLVETTETLHPDFVPPEFVTASSLPERLYEPTHTFATKSVERLAWYEALRSVDRNAIRAYVPNPPSDEDFTGWMALANQLIGLHRDLLADQLDFASVVGAGHDLTGFDRAEERRWSILSEIQKKYLAILDRELVWDRQTARKVAVEQSEIATQHDIVLIGSVDLNRTMRSILDEIPDRVTALVHAPEDQQHLFDDYGCLVTETWQQYPIELIDEQVHIVERHTNQARQVVNCLARYQGKFSADEITIGITDENLVPVLRRHLAASDVAARWVVEKSISETAPYRLLRAVAAFIDSNGNRTNESSWWQASQFATLIRHPDLESWLHQQSCFDGDEIRRNWLVQLDGYMADHLQPMLGFWLGNSNKCNSLRAVFELVEELLKPIERRNERRALLSKRLTEWCDPIREVLLNVYGNQELNRENAQDRIVIHAMESLFEALTEQAKIPEQLEPKVNASQAIQVLLESVGQDPIPPLPDDTAVEMLGWLELSLDDAPALVITSFNEGFVPDSVTSDAFLPNQLRKRLGLSDNDSRYARDAYALTTMLHSRENVQLIIGRRDSRDDPLKPSRLLFATDPESIAGRVLSFLEPNLDPATEETPVEASKTVQPKKRKKKKKRVDSAQKTFSFDDFDDESADDVEPGDEADTETTISPVERPVVAPPTQTSVLRVFDPAHHDKPSPFIVPVPEKGEPLESISVTSFRNYLQSPYRFYLRHVKRLKTADDRPREMDAMRFGNLVHDVLERFGHSGAKDSTSAKEIRAQVMASLDASVEHHLGRYRTAAVNVQIEQMRQRLSRFATWQARWASDGWRIYYAEENDDQISVQLDLAKGQSIGLHGRIDRIDRNFETGEFAILDYKTGDKLSVPEKSHQQKGEWVDLQLPLYTLLAESLGVFNRPKLGYIALPARLEHVGDQIATWTDADIDYALDVARHVALRILKQDFKKLDNHNVIDRFDDFGRICQTMVRAES